MNPQKRQTSFTSRRKSLVSSPSSQSQNQSSSQKNGGSAMEKFGYNKMWKTARLINLVYPVIFLIIILVMTLFVLEGMAEFKWWMPLFVVALIVWATIEFRNYRKSLSFLVELSEEAIRVNGMEARWTDITKVEKRRLLGNSFEISLHTNSGTSLIVPAQTDSLAYINGFVDSHTKSVGSQ